MCLFFDQKKLENEACNDPNKMVTMLFYHWKKPIIPTKGMSRQPLNGYSFLLNPKDFFGDTTTDILYRIQYLKLAAMRDYLLYKEHRYKALQLSFYPDINIQAIKHNPLLVVTPNEVTFKYEERK